MKPKKASRFRCPNCDNDYEDYFDAENCCPPDIDEIEGYVCGECDEFYEDRDEAKECCK